jgi:hypothetical protein
MKIKLSTQKCGEPLILLSFFSCTAGGEGAHTSFKASAVAIVVASVRQVHLDEVVFGLLINNNP